MSETKTISPAVEPINTHHSHLLCWKSIFAGLLITFMAHMILSTLGFAVFGVAAQSAIENERGAGVLATSFGLWMAFSVIISLFLGSYFTVRIAKSLTHKVGAAHGFVVSSAFFIIVTVLASNAIGTFSMGVGNLVAGLGQGAQAMGSNPRVQDTINQAFGSDTFKADPKVVSEGLAVRLLRGDVESAKAYYAYQTGLGQAEVSQRIDELNARFIATAKEVGDKAAEAAAAMGFSLFIVFVLGAASGMFGGRYATHANVDRPLEAKDAFTSHNHGPMFANARS